MINKYQLHLQRLVLLGFTLFTFIYCYFTNNTSWAQNVHENDKKTYEFVKSSDIKSVKFHRKGWELTEPAMELRGNDQLMLSFDDLSENSGSFSYKIVHCDSEWNPTPIFFSDYMDGFEVNEIRDYSFSSGSIVNYTHYSLNIPNEDVNIKISGNYLLCIFNTYNPDEIIIQRRFILYESLLGISAGIRQPSAGEHRYSGQQMDLKIDLSGLRVIDPQNEIKTKVCQNYPFQGCFENIEPVHISNDEIDYSHFDALIFEGGNEFRFFDTKNIRYQGQGIQAIDFYGGMFHVQLRPDEGRRRDRYSYYSDLNGKYVVNLERSDRSETEADYVWTYFTLKAPMEVDKGYSIYLFGELTSWQLSPDNKLNYNPINGTYEIRLLLKQGAYNYRYVLANESKGKVDVTYFEGSHFDTENNYMVMVYYKPLGARYERVLGYKTISTVR